MPTRLKALLVVFILFSLTNVGNAALIAYRHSLSAWPARCILSVAVAGVYLACAYSIWKKRKEAQWCTTIFIAALMVMIFAPDIYRFGNIVSRRNAATVFAPDIQIEWARALIYLSFVVFFPAFVYWLVSSAKSKAWLRS